MASLPSVDALFKKSWADYKPRMGHLALFMLAQMAITMCVEIGATIIGLLITLPAIISWFAQKNIGVSSLAWWCWIFIILASLVFLAIIIISSVWLNASLIAMVINPQTETDSITAALKTGWQMKWKYFGASFLSGLLTIVGTILLFFPGIWIGNLLIYADILAVRGMKPTDALRTSKKLVTGNWWGTFGRWCLVTILFVFLPLAVIVGMMMAGKFSEGIAVLGSLLYFIFIFILAFCLTPWLMIFRNTLLEAAEKNPADDPEQLA